MTGFCAAASSGFGVLGAGRLKSGIAARLGVEVRVFFNAPGLATPKSDDDLAVIDIERIARGTKPACG